MFYSKPYQMFVKKNIDPARNKPAYVNNFNGDDPDEYKNGVSFGFGPFSFGYDIKNIRD